MSQFSWKPLSPDREITAVIQYIFPSDRSPRYQDRQHRRLYHLDRSCNTRLPTHQHPRISTASGLSVPSLLSSGGSLVPWTINHVTDHILVRNSRGVETLSPSRDLSIVEVCVFVVNPRQPRLESHVTTSYLSFIFTAVNLLTFTSCC